MNVTFVKAQSTYGLLTTEENVKVKQAQDKNVDLLKVPRRPLWDKSMSGEELQQLEREAFMLWRKGLSELQEIEGITLTPYEKNLEFWRQLWRVIERSDIIVQIVDARNPLLFRCRDLEKYVCETSGQKKNLILINKADFLSEKQREFWVDYFDSIDLPVAFFSALEEAHAQQLRMMKISEQDEGEEEEDEEEADEGDERDVKEEGEDQEEEDDDDQYVTESGSESESQESVDKHKRTPKEKLVALEEKKSRTRLLTRAELIQLLKSLTRNGDAEQTPHRTVAGFVGYPNVGKSSTLNALLTYKKASVSSTPGKTKHFQVLDFH